MAKKLHNNPKASKNREDFIEGHINGPFPWTILFLVTGICFMAFSGVLAMLDGSGEFLLMKIGIVSTGFGVIGLLNIIISNYFYSTVVKPQREQDGDWADL